MAYACPYHLRNSPQRGTTQRAGTNVAGNNCGFTRLLLSRQCLSERRVSLLDRRLRQRRKCLLVQPSRFFRYVQWADIFARAGEPSGCRYKYDDCVAPGELYLDDADRGSDYTRADESSLHAQLYGWHQRKRSTEHEQLGWPGRV